MVRLPALCSDPCSRGVSAVDISEPAVFCEKGIEKCMCFSSFQYCFLGRLIVSWAEAHCLGRAEFLEKLLASQNGFWSVCWYDVVL